MCGGVEARGKWRASRSVRGWVVCALRSLLCSVLRLFQSPFSSLSVAVWRSHCCVCLSALTETVTVASHRIASSRNAHARTHPPAAGRQTMDALRCRRGAVSWWHLCGAVRWWHLCGAVSWYLCGAGTVRWWHLCCLSHCWYYSLATLPLTCRTPARGYE